MVSHDDIVSFLDRLSADGATHTELSEGIWNVKPAGALDFGVVVNYSPPVVVLRIKVMDLPAGGPQRGALEHRLLELHDFEEFLSAYESITLALASHIRELASFREAR